MTAFVAVFVAGVFIGGFFGCLAMAVVAAGAIDDLTPDDADVVIDLTDHATEPHQ